MSYIETFMIPHSTIIRLHSEREDIQLDPDYQRMGGVWTPEKKQLLIDSILNDYDIPKIYFHEFTREQRAERGDKSKFAVIDGRQRIEAIWQFIDGQFALSNDFEYQDNPKITLAGLGYSDIASEYPKIKIKFDSYVLPVIGVVTDDNDLIEDMFSRLNEAVPLNAAEKRNAIGGDLVKAIRELGYHEFFTRCVAFGNRRYQHREAAARFLLVEQSLSDHGKVVDTKKEYLDAFARNYREGHTKAVTSFAKTASSVLDVMAGVFLERDDLLRAQGNMVPFYLACKSAIGSNKLNLFSRKKLLAFRDEVQENRLRAEKDYTNARFDWLEYDRLTQQGTNDASNIRERVRILCEYLKLKPVSA